MILLSLALSRSTEFRSYTFRVRGEWQVTKWQSMLVCFHRSSYIYILIEFFPSRWYFINIYLFFFLCVLLILPFGSKCLVISPHSTPERSYLQYFFHIFIILLFPFFSFSFSFLWSSHPGYHAVLQSASQLRSPSQLQFIKRKKKKNIHRTTFPIKVTWQKIHSRERERFNFQTTKHFIRASTGTITLTNKAFRHPDS